MKTRFITRKCFGGGVSRHTEITTDEFRGIKLGAEILDSEKIIEEATDHIVAEDADTMTFDFGSVRKARIKALVWHRDEVTKSATVRFVLFC